MVGFTNKQKLDQDNKNLRLKLSLINTKLQRLSFLEYENSELKTLLNCSKKIKDKILPAQLLTSVTNSFSQQVTIDRGKTDGIYIGQPVLDAYGLFGQVIAVESNMSIVMLITNNKSATPVMVTRNGLQTIAIGHGNNDHLELTNIHETADIKVGDSLVTSGLGQAFPAGYKVGTVREVKRMIGERFMKVLISPQAQINKDLYVFLIWPTSADKKKVK